MAIDVTWFTDPACPWAYSANPAFAVLRWRYGAQLNWRLVTIGLSENTDRYASYGFTPARSAQHAIHFRRYGMPFGAAPRTRLLASARGCRAIVATRLLAPEREESVHRALQLAWANTTLLLDEDEGIAAALAGVPDLDVAAIVAALDSDAVTAAYEADKAETRTAAGGPTEFQGKASTSDGPVRFTAPSLVFELDGRRLEAGGFQPVEAYDLCVANLDPTIERRQPPETPLPALLEAPDGLVTQEVAAIMTHGNAAPDRDAAEAALISLVAEGSVRRAALGDDALWQAVGVGAAAGSRDGLAAVAGAVSVG
jgi:2-hydroxychromene-2-carboxylate isomerase